MTRCTACGKPLTASGAHCDDVCKDAADREGVVRRVEMKLGKPLRRGVVYTGRAWRGVQTSEG